MIAERYREMLQEKSVIRELFTFATERGAQIGYENVFDYSLGNPSVPVPDSFRKGMEELYEELDETALHGYSPTLGIPSVLQSVAKSLKKRFGLPYTKEHIFMTSGAASALAHAFRAISVPGDEIITFAPYFPEYKPYVELSGVKLRIVPAQTKDFQISVHQLETMIGE